MVGLGGKPDSSSMVVGGRAERVILSRFADVSRGMKAHFSLN